MATPQQYTKLAKALPPGLLNFFTKFPPGTVPQTQPVTREVLTPNSTTRQRQPLGQRPEGDYTHPVFDPHYNPFLPWRNPTTQRWRPAMYSLRRQAALVKAAQKHDVEALLPFTPKLSWVKHEKRIQHGLKVRGTGVGQRVKGKKWERKIAGTLEQRREAMRKMPEMIKEWKEVSLLRGSPSLSFFLTISVDWPWPWMEKVAKVNFDLVYRHIACAAFKLLDASTLRIEHWRTGLLGCIRITGVWGRLKAIDSAEHWKTSSRHPLSLYK